LNLFVFYYLQKHLCAPLVCFCPLKLPKSNPSHKNFDRGRSPKGQGYISGKKVRQINGGWSKVFPLSRAFVGRFVDLRPNLTYSFSITYKAFACSSCVLLPLKTDQICSCNSLPLLYI